MHCLRCTRPHRDSTPDWRTAIGPSDSLGDSPSSAVVHRAATICLPLLVRYLEAVDIDDAQNTCACSNRLSRAGERCPTCQHAPGVAPAWRSRTACESRLQLSRRRIATAWHGRGLGSRSPCSQGDCPLRTGRYSTSHPYLRARLRLYSHGHRPPPRCWEGYLDASPSAGRGLKPAQQSLWISRKP